MQLVIQDKKQLLTDKFATWLLKRIKEKLIQYFDESKLEPWDIFFETDTKYKSLFVKKIKSKDIVICGLNNIIYNKSKNMITYMINPNVYLPYFDRVHVDDICKAINYGTLSQQGYPIFTNTFRFFEDNFSDIIDEYLSVG